jgi:hypothetical protein
MRCDGLDNGKPDAKRGSYGLTPIYEPCPSENCKTMQSIAPGVQHDVRGRESLVAGSELSQLLEIVERLLRILLPAEAQR